MNRRARVGGGWAAIAALVLSVTGCIPENPSGLEDPGGTTSGDVGDEPLAVRDLPVQTVDWSPDAAALDGVRAVATRGGTTVVFGDDGAALFSGGVLTGTDAAVTAPRAAAVIPAADHDGLWIAAVDADGRVWRLVAGESFEGVSSLYGLSEEAVVGLVPMGEKGTVFALGGGLAVSDGTLVTRYDTGALVGLAASDARAAGVTAEGISVLEPGTGTLTKFALPGAAAVAFDDLGRLLALTPEALYRERADGTLHVVHRSEAGGLRSLAAAPGHVWFADGTTLGLVDDVGVGLSATGTLTAGAALQGSPTGDVWVLEGGSLSRVAVDIGSAGHRQTWEEAMKPIFEASCTPCHEPGGSAPTVLSTYESWELHRDSLRTKVIEDETMPPSGYELAAEDRKAIEAWLDAK